MGLAGKKLGTTGNIFWFQVRFRGLITLGVWKSAKKHSKITQTRFAQTVSNF